MKSPRATGKNYPIISAEWFVGGSKFGREVTCNSLTMLIMSPPPTTTRSSNAWGFSTAQLIPLFTTLFQYVHEMEQLFCSCTVAWSNCRPWQCSQTTFNKTILINLYCNSCWNRSPPALFHTHITNYVTCTEIHVDLLWYTMTADSAHIVQHICVFLSNSKIRTQTVCSYKLSKTQLNSLVHFFHWKVFSQKKQSAKGFKETAIFSIILSAFLFHCLN